VKLQRSIIRLLQYHEVIPNTVLGIFVNYVQSIIADENVDWVYEHDYIVIPPAPDFLANRKHSSSSAAKNQSF
jgi:hypothetical protein